MEFLKDTYITSLAAVTINDVGIVELYTKSVMDNEDTVSVSVLMFYNCF